MPGTVIGGKELAAALRELPKALRNKLARPAMRAGAKIISAQAKTNVHSITGRTRKSIKTSVRIKGAVIIATIGPKPAGQTGKGQDAFYMPWEEEGHFTGGGKRPRLSRGESRSADRDALYKARSIAAGRKWVSGTFFMRNALQAKGDAAAQAVVAKLKIGIEGTKLN